MGRGPVFGACGLEETMDGFYDCATGGLHSGLDEADAAVPSNIIKLPDWQDLRARRLRAAIADAITTIGFETVCRLRLLGTSRYIEIDEFAAVVIPTNSRDFLFLLRMTHGPEILLITDDMDMMVDFVRQYAWACIVQDPVLECILQ